MIRDNKVGEHADGKERDDGAMITFNTGCLCLSLNLGIPHQVRLSYCKIDPLNGQLW